MERIRDTVPYGKQVGNRKQGTVAPRLLFRRGTGTAGKQGRLLIRQGTQPRQETPTG